MRTKEDVHRFVCRGDRQKTKHRREKYQVHIFCAWRYAYAIATTAKAMAMDGGLLHVSSWRHLQGSPTCGTKSRGWLSSEDWNIRGTNREIPRWNGAKYSFRYGFALREATESIGRISRTVALGWDIWHRYSRRHKGDNADGTMQCYALHHANSQKPCEAWHIGDIPERGRTTEYWWRVYSSKCQATKWSSARGLQPGVDAIHEKECGVAAWCNLKR